MDKIFNYHPFTEVEFDNKTIDQQQVPPTSKELVQDASHPRLTGRPITGNDILRDLDRTHDLR